MIGIDWDGVVVDTASLKRQAAMEMFSIVLPFNRLSSNQILADGLINEKEYDQLRHEIYEGKYAHRSQLVTNAAHFIKLLQEFHRLVVITSRKDKKLDNAMAIAQREGLDLEFIGVGFGSSKRSAAQERGCKVYIDDEPHKLVKLIGAVPNLFLFGWPYNQEAVLEPPIKRLTTGWLGFYTAIKHLEK